MTDWFKDIFRRAAGSAIHTLKDDELVKSAGFFKEALEKNPNAVDSLNGFRVSQLAVPEDILERTPVVATVKSPKDPIATYYHSYEDIPEHIAYNINTPTKNKHTLTSVAPHENTHAIQFSDLKQLPKKYKSSLEYLDKVRNYSDAFNDAMQYPGLRNKYEIASPVDYYFNIPTERMAHDLEDYVPFGHYNEFPTFRKDFPRIIKETAKYTIDDFKKRFKDIHLDAKKNFGKYLTLAGAAAGANALLPDEGETASFPASAVTDFLKKQAGPAWPSIPQELKDNVLKWATHDVPKSFGLNTKATDTADRELLKAGLNDPLVYDIKPNDFNNLRLAQAVIPEKVMEKINPSFSLIDPELASAGNFLYNPISGNTVIGYHPTKWKRSTPGHEITHGVQEIPAFRPEFDVKTNVSLDAMAQTAEDYKNLVRGAPFRFSQLTPEFIKSVPEHIDLINTLKEAYRHNPDEVAARTVGDYFESGLLNKDYSGLRNYNDFKDVFSDASKNAFKEYTEKFPERGYEILQDVIATGLKDGRYKRLAIPSIAALGAYGLSENDADAAPVTIENIFRGGKKTVRDASGRLTYPMQDRAAYRFIDNPIGAGYFGDVFNAKLNMKNLFDPRTDPEAALKVAQEVANQGIMSERDATKHLLTGNWDALELGENNIAGQIGSIQKILQDFGYSGNHQLEPTHFKKNRWSELRDLVPRRYQDVFQTFDKNEIQMGENAFDRYDLNNLFGQYGIGNKMEANLPDNYFRLTPPNADNPNLFRKDELVRPFTLYNGEPLKQFHPNFKAMLEEFRPDAHYLDPDYESRYLFPPSREPFSLMDARARHGLTDIPQDGIATPGLISKLNYNEGHEDKPLKVLKNEIKTNLSLAQQNGSPSQIAKLQEDLDTLNLYMNPKSKKSSTEKTAEDIVKKLSGNLSINFDDKTTSLKSVMAKLGHMLDGATIDENQPVLDAVNNDIKTVAEHIKETQNEKLFQQFKNAFGITTHDKYLKNVETTTPSDEIPQSLKYSLISGIDTKHNNLYQLMEGLKNNLNIADFTDDSSGYNQAIKDIKSVSKHIKDNDIPFMSDHFKSIFGDSMYNQHFGSSTNQHINNVANLISSVNAKDYNNISELEKALESKFEKAEYFGLADEDLKELKNDLDYIKSYKNDPSNNDDELFPSLKSMGIKETKLAPPDLEDLLGELSAKDIPKGKFDYTQNNPPSIKHTLYADALLSPDTATPAVLKNAKKFQAENPDFSPEKLHAFNLTSDEGFNNYTKDFDPEDFHFSYFVPKNLTDTKSPYYNPQITKVAKDIGFKPEAFALGHAAQHGEFPDWYVPTDNDIKYIKSLDHTNTEGKSSYFKSNVINLKTAAKDWEYTKNKTEKEVDTLMKDLGIIGLGSAAATLLYPNQSDAGLKEKVTVNPRELGKNLEKSIIDYLEGRGERVAEPKEWYRGIPAGATPESVGGDKYVHATPWGDVAAIGGKVLGSSKNDVYSYDTLENAKYFRGGSLAGDPLEMTGVGDIQGVSWDDALNKAKGLYDKRLGKSLDNVLGFGVKGDELNTYADEASRNVAENVAREFKHGTYETDAFGKPGVWEGAEKIPSTFKTKRPLLRSNDELYNAVKRADEEGISRDNIAEVKILKGLGNKLPDLEKADAFNNPYGNFIASTIGIIPGMAWDLAKQYGGTLKKVFTGEAIDSEDTRNIVDIATLPVNAVKGNAALAGLNILWPDNKEFDEKKMVKEGIIYPSNFIPRKDARGKVLIDTSKLNFDPLGDAMNNFNQYEQEARNFF